MRSRRSIAFSEAGGGTKRSAEDELDPEVRKRLAKLRGEADPTALD